MNPLRYGATAVALHWLIFALVAAGFALGLYLTELPSSPDKLRFTAWHRSIGVTIFWLALVRAAWRLAHPAPPLPSTLPAWRRRTAGLTHALLYMLIVVVPLSGWLHSSAAGTQTVYLGWLALPDAAGRSEALAATLKVAHVTLNYALFALVSLHAGAALAHHYIEGDGVLARMLPFAKLRDDG